MAGAPALAGEGLGEQNTLTLMSILLAVLKRPWIVILSLLVVMVPLIEVMPPPPLRAPS